MNARLLVPFAAAILTASTVMAAPPSVHYTPVTCMRSGELPLLQVAVEGKGELRGYFRLVNATDWCSVEGTNDGPLSRVVFPKFNPGDEVEYFFVLLDGRRVIARTPRIYRSHVNAECETAWARHVLKLVLNCGDDAQGIPSSLGAGFGINNKLIDNNPPYGSPDRPPR